MKKQLLITMSAMFLTMILSSCSVNKRVYMDGYHVEWNHKKKSEPVAKQEEPIIKEENIVSVPAVPEEKAESPKVSPAEEPVIASSEKAVPEVAPKKKIWDRIIKEDTPEEQEQIRAGSKAMAFKSGFKQGLKFMLVDAEAHNYRVAIASFVLGIVALFSYYGAFLLGLLAIIFGAIALRRIKRGEGSRGSTFAWIGIICGIVAIVLATVLIQVI